MTESYDYDALGNMTLIGDKALLYQNPNKPHQATFVVGARQSLNLAHDSNGNRTQKSIASGGGADYYDYDSDDRLEQIRVSRPTGTEVVDFHYDYTGTRVAKEVASGSVTRYYSSLVETTSDGFTMKSYYLGGMRVASRLVDSNGWELASLRGEVWLARAAMEHPAMVLVLEPKAQAGAAATLLLVTVAILFVPRRRRRGMREAHVVGVVILFVVGTLPLPLMVQVAKADCEPPSSIVQHYHYDHLGSVQAVTGDDGTLLEQIRYTPYGRIRGRWDGAGAAIANPSAEHRYEFTGYETELISGLQYAGARFYDPSMGSFLTHDPAGVFASPYTYTNWDPVNRTDPNGECGFLVGIDCIVIALILVGLASVATGIDTGITTGDASSGFAAFGISAAFGYGTFGLGSAIAVPLGATPGLVQIGIGAAAVGYGAYGTYEAVDNGYYATGSVGVLATAFGVYELLSPAPQGANAAPGSGSGGYQSRKSRGLHQTEIDEYSQLYHGRKMSWSNVRLDNSTGAGGRPFTWRWPWSKQVTVHLGGYYSPDPILGASEAAATLAHELGHAVDFARDGSEPLPAP